jgi:simple sugar transport system permease protein
MLLFMKINPLSVGGEAIRKIFTDHYTTGEIFVKATPLIFTSLAFAFTYKANLYNIGAQGQFYAARSRRSRSRSGWGTFCRRRW